MRVLLVEDDALIARDVGAALLEAGYVVDVESSGEGAWFAGDTEDYAAAVLDLGLPVLDGLSVLRRWRENGRRFPVLILTARGNWTERVEGIDAGADDYLAKPFRMEELLARLRAIVRRSAGHASAVLVARGLRIDTRTRGVTFDGASRSLTPMEYRCLVFLVMHAGRVVSRQELTEQLYAQDFERESNSVEVLVGRLRRKLGGALIETRRGFGYLVSETGAGARGDAAPEPR